MKLLSVVVPCYNEEETVADFYTEFIKNKAFFDENDLDYRKDLAKITNTIKGSKIYQDVKERFASPQEPEDEIIEESYIRNVNEYEDEFAPIINITRHASFRMENSIF